MLKLCTSDMKGRSPLTAAVEKGDDETFQELLKRGAKIESEIGGKVWLTDSP